MSYMESYEGENPNGVTDEMCHIVIADTPAVLRLSDCILSAGTYTLQFWIRSTTALNVALESNGLYASFVSTTKWTKYVFTFTTNDVSDGSIMMSLPVGIYYLWHVKLESGNTASEWTPAPELMLLAMDDTPVDSKLYKLSDTYTDKLGCDNGIWYIERNTQLLTLDGSEGWNFDGVDIYMLTISMCGCAYDLLPAISNYFTYADVLTKNNTFRVINTESKTVIQIKTDIDDFTTWLGTNNVEVLIPANTSTVRLANYLQTALNSFTVSDSLQVTLDDVGEMSGAVLVKPIVFGTISGNMSALIENTSDDDIGFIYQIHCKDEVVNPVIYLTETNQHIKLNATFKKDDVITIDTRRTKKSVTKTYMGADSNIINKLDNTSKWLQLQSGYNHLIQTADIGADNMDSTIIYTNEYEGV